MTNEAFARIKIDQFLMDLAWRLTDGVSALINAMVASGRRALSALQAKVRRESEAPPAVLPRVHHGGWR